MVRYIGRPVVVEAHQHGVGMLPDGFQYAVQRQVSSMTMEIKTLDGPRLCKPGDWIVRGPGGDFRVMHQAEFETMFAPFTAAALVVTPKPAGKPDITLRVKRPYTKRKHVDGR